MHRQCILVKTFFFPSLSHCIGRPHQLPPTTGLLNILLSFSHPFWSQSPPTTGTTSRSSGGGQIYVFNKKMEGYFRYLKRIQKGTLHSDMVKTSNLFYKNIIPCCLLEFGVFYFSFTLRTLYKSYVKCCCSWADFYAVICLGSKTVANENRSTGKILAEDHWRTTTTRQFSQSVRDWRW